MSNKARTLYTHSVQNLCIFEDIKNYVKMNICLHSYMISLWYVRECGHVKPLLEFNDGLDVLCANYRQIPSFLQVYLCLKDFLE